MWGHCSPVLHTLQKTVYPNSTLILFEFMVENSKDVGAKWIKNTWWLYEL